MVKSAATTSLSDEELAELKVRCLTLPLHGMTLMLPNTVVAEVVDYREPEKAGQMPEWMLGMLPWRGRSVPLVAFEKLLGQEQAMRSEETRFIVCNTLGGNGRIPFIAMQVEGIPHLVQVDNSMLEMDNDIEQAEPAVQAYLRLQGESVIVPNIDVIEKMLEHLGITTG
jgi:chemosensory pili system protein ChpC